MSGRRTGLLLAAGVLALGLIGALLWLLLAGGGRRGPSVSGPSAQATNPALNVRFSYSTRHFTLAPYNGRAEFPLRLDAVALDGVSPFGLYGKRLGGLGRMLGQDPAPMLYDFAGAQSDAMFIDNYGLKPLHDPRYEDAKIGGKLALHQQLSFSREASAPWPVFFPPALQSATEAYIEGWTLFTADDLFYFYAVSAKPLEDGPRHACLGVLNSLEFNAVQSATARGAPDAGPTPEAAPPAPQSSATPDPAPPATEPGAGAAPQPPAAAPPADATTPGAPAPR